MDPVIAIVGSGAVGCYYGGRLAQHGQNVHFLFRSMYDAVHSRGLVVQSLDGNFSIPPDRLHAYHDPRQMPKADLIIVALKTTSNDQYHSLIRPLLKEQTLILTIQNGLGNEDQLAELFGEKRILGGLAFVCINRMEDGSIRHFDHGKISLAEFVGPPQARTEQIAKMFADCQVRCELLDDLRYARWEKLIWNVPFNGLGAVLDKTTDQLIATNEGQAIVRTLMAEIIAVAASLGISFPPEIIDQKIEHTLSMGAYRTSMQIDRQQHRPLEVESILGRPLEIARRKNITTPYLEMLYRVSTLV